MTLAVSDDDEVILNLMSRPMKDKGKQKMDEKAARKEEKRRKREAMSPEELD